MDDSLPNRLYVAALSASVPADLRRLLREAAGAVEARQAEIDAVRREMDQLRRSVEVLGPPA